MYDIVDIRFYPILVGIHLMLSFLIICFYIERYIFRLFFSLFRIYHHGTLSMLF